MLGCENYRAFWVSIIELRVNKMRDIKFRQLLKPELVYNNESFHFWGFVGDGFMSPCGKNDIISESQQFTGLKDKNGIEIFEGDILAYGENVPERAVIFENGAFRLADDTNQSDQILVTDTAKRLIITGNIYENPELFESVK